MSLYIVCFTSEDGTFYVVALHAKDEEDALYCLNEGYREVIDPSFTRCDNLEVGVMLTVYEQ